MNKTFFVVCSGSLINEFERHRKVKYSEKEKGKAYDDFSENY